MVQVFLTVPMILKKVQKRMVRRTKGQFHWCLSWMVATPRNMKMMVSDDELSILSAYLSVVCDLDEMFRST